MAHAIEPPETLHVETERVACDGSEGALGHPRVYLNMEGKGEIQCPYCGRLYILDGETAHAHAH
jgi:uncharacterized Zn-finger protein